MDLDDSTNYMKHIYELLLEFINSDESNINFDNLADFIQLHNIFKEKDELHEFLILINKISKNHYRNANFFTKIEQIILYYKKIINETFTNFEIFHFFRYNKKVLLFLLQQQIITFDTDIVDIITQKTNPKFVDHPYYFFNEIKSFIPENEKNAIEQTINNIISDDYDKYEKMRQIGENDSYICSLIRKDSIDEFIIYINQKNLPLSFQIEPSIFETNPYLTNKVKLIEYAAFFGSIKIFQYLHLNNVPLEKSLWHYAIHSNNAELIQILEEKSGNLKNTTKEQLMKESIKCHHNELAHYFEQNIINQVNESIKEETVDIPATQNKQSTKEKILNFFGKIIKKQKDNIIEEAPNQPIENANKYKEINEDGFRYHNYEFLPSNLNQKSYVEYLVKYDYIFLVKLLIQNKLLDVNEIHNNVLN